MEKLIGEIADRICNVCDVNEYAVPLEEPIKWAITRIGEAVLSGECADLDKLLGVVRREHGLNTFIDLIDGPLGRREELTYIAFRPPETEPDEKD